MNFFSQIACCLMLLFILYGLIQRLRSQKHLISKPMLIKGFETAGWLSLALIAFVALLIFSLKEE